MKNNCILCRLNIKSITTEQEFEDEFLTLIDSEKIKE